MVVARTADQYVGNVAAIVVIIVIIVVITMDTTSQYIITVTTIQQVVTDPAEGAALARATLEALRRPGMTTMATTHQGVLKSWAFTTEGAACAAMDFDEEALRPTFRILMGAAGTSAGLTVEPEPNC